MAKGAHVKFTVLLDRTLGRKVYRAHRWLYRTSHGRVGHRGPLGPMLLLRTRGRRSGALREVALLYYRDGPTYYVVASNGGRREHPGWLANVRANAAVDVQVGRRSQKGDARVLSDQARALLWPTLTDFYPGWALYQTLAERTIAVVAIVTAS